MLTVAVMQPYLLPYVGYFQLIMKADVFILLDDVQYIRRGWINRNRILLRGQVHAIRLPVAAASRRTPINQIQIADESHPYLNRQQTMLKHAYGTCSGWAMVQHISECVTNKDLSGPLLPVLTNSIKKCCDTLGIHQNIIMASELGGESLRGQQRILHLVKTVGGTRYINLPGGIDLYDESFFEDNGIELKFLLPKFEPYQQVGVTEFVPALSILDFLASKTPSSCLDSITDGEAVTRQELIKRTPLS